MEQEKFKITHVEGQFLLKAVSRARLPEKVGDEKFDIGVQVNADDQIRIARKELRAYSPILQKKRVLCFGDESNWTLTKKAVMCAKCDKEQVSEADHRDMIDPDLGKEVRFSEDGILGILWALFMYANPRSPIATVQADLDEMVWPLAEKFGLDDELKRMLGLDRAKAKTLIRKKAGKAAE